MWTRRGCVSLESEEKGKEVEVITDKQIDRQTDKWTEFPLVDSIPVLPLKEVE